MIRVVEVPEMVLITVVIMAVFAAILIAANLVPDKKRDS
jgi:hypothetical protein